MSTNGTTAGTTNSTGRGTSHYPSDGLLPEYTQKLQGIPPGNVYRILNANHKSLLNLSYKGTEGDNTRKEFNKIFTNRPDGDFFITPQRP